jgi:DNA polymerase-3 subunit epsilon
MRQIVLDTETTGLSPSQGHRIIEIGCVEIINRRLTGREFHRRVDPERDIDEGAQRVHGISRESLIGQPRFADVADELLDFIRDGELVIHNAEFDVGFLEHELQLMNHAQPVISQHAMVLDTLSLARQMHPGQRNSLDALCKRYAVDASQRDVHGALIDAELLARVYLSMTGGQAALSLDADDSSNARTQNRTATRRRRDDLTFVVISASVDDVAAHNTMLDRMQDEGACLWREQQEPG